VSESFAGQFQRTVSLLHHALLAEAQPQSSGVLVQEDFSDLDASTIRSHRLSRFVLNHATSAGLTPDATEAIRQDALAHTHAALELVGNTVTVSQALREANIDHLVFKGVALGALASTTAGRGAGDVDILVHPGDLARVEEVLVGLGCRPGHALPPYDNRLAWAIHAFLDRERSYHSSSLQIDVHWRIAPMRGLLPPLDVLLERHTEVQLGRHHVPTLNLSDSLAASCFHAYLDRFQPLRSVLDVVFLIRAHGGATLPEYSPELRALLAGVITLCRDIFPGVLDKEASALLAQLPQPDGSVLRRFDHAAETKRVTWTQQADVGTLVKEALAQSRLDRPWEFLPRFVGKRLFLFPPYRDSKPTASLGSAFFARLRFETGRLVPRRPKRNRKIARAHG